MNQRIVTIAIIVQSEEQDFRKTILCALEQDYKEIEVLVCAAKLSGNITLYLNQLVREDKRMRIIYHPEVSQSRLKSEALRHANGEYILYLNGSDLIDGDYLSTFLKKMNDQKMISGKKIDVVKSGKILLSGDHFLRTCFYEYDTFVEENKILEEMLIRDYIGEQIWNMLIRTELLSTLFFDERDKFFDIHLIYKLFHHAHTMLFISDFKYYVHVEQDINSLRKNQMTVNHNRESLSERLERVEAYWTRYEEIKKKYPELQDLLLRPFLKESLQILVIYPENGKAAKKNTNRLQILHDIVFQKGLLRERLILLNRKEQLVLQHGFLGKVIYRYIRKMEEKYPETYQKKNAQIDSVLSRILQNKGSIQTEKEKHFDLESNKIYLIGTPEYHNLGDHAIAYAEEQFIKRYFSQMEIITITEQFFLNNIDFLVEKIKRTDIILLQGGGNMGSEYKEQESIRSKVILKFPHNHIVIMPQTIYFKKSKDSQKLMERMSQCYGQHRDLTLVAREEVSYSIMKNRFKKNKILLCPDIVLSLPFDRIAESTFLKESRKGVLLVIRSDTEGMLTISQLMDIKKWCIQYFGSTRMTETSISYEVAEEDREIELKKKWKEFLTAEVVITDRLHGMIFAAITGTPCIVLTNYNHKLSGSYQWVESLPYIKYCNRVESLQEQLKSMKNEILNNKSYRMPENVLKGYYEKLAEAISKENKNV